jgi:hypothetical protein
VILEIRDDRQMRALTGLPHEKIEVLESAFTEVYHEEQQREYEEGLAAGKRQRKPGGGRKGILPSIRDKLLFLLYYLKVNPTFDVMGVQFGMSRSKACENVHKLMPLLYKTLVRLEVLPYREFSSVEEFITACQGIEKLLIDVTERLHRRPQDDDQQSEMYSGKKRNIHSKTPLSPP